MFVRTCNPPHLGFVTPHDIVFHGTDTRRPHARVGEASSRCRQDCAALRMWHGGKTCPRFAGAVLAAAAGARWATRRGPAGSQRAFWPEALTRLPPATFATAVLRGPSPVAVVPERGLSEDTPPFRRSIGFAGQLENLDVILICGSYRCVANTPFSESFLF